MGWPYQPLLPASAQQQAVAAYSVNAESGGYVLSGLAATMLATRIVNAATGTYSITGADAATVFGRFVNAAAGGYVITGPQAATLAGRVLNAALSSYMISGLAADINRGRVVNAEAGSYVVLGHDATLVVAASGYSFNAEAGGYTLVGPDAGLLAGRAVNSEPGIYVLTGPNAVTVAGRLLQADPDAYLITGQPATALAERLINAEPESYLVVGADTSLRLTDVVMLAGGGAYLITGESAKAVLEVDMIVGSSADVAQIVTGIWNALASDFNESGTMGEKVNAAGTAGDPWTTELPGSYTGIQAGNIIGTNLDSKVSDIELVTVGAALNKRAESSVVTTGNVVSGDYLSTWNDDGSYYQISDVGGAIDLYLEFNVGSGLPVGAMVVGSCAGLNNDVDIYVYNWALSTWGYFGNLGGKNAPSNYYVPLTLYVTNVGAGDDLGKVRIRFQNTGLTTANLYLDQVYVNYSASAATTADIADAVWDAKPKGLLDVNKFIGLK